MRCRPGVGVTAHPSRQMPPHGLAAWDGSAGLGAAGEVRSILNPDEALRPSVEVGCVVWTKADEGARGGMVIEVEVTLDGERMVTVVTHNENPQRPHAWTFRLPESDFDPAKTTPDNVGRRHAYAKACYKAAAQGRYVTEAHLHLLGIGSHLVHDCVVPR